MLAQVICSFLTIFSIYSWFFIIIVFLKNGKQGVQTVRLDMLNNIVTWANMNFIYQN